MDAAGLTVLLAEHVMRHAYDLTLRPDRLSELASVAERLAAELPAWCAEFGSKVRAEQHWEQREFASPDRLPVSFHGR